MRAGARARAIVSRAAAAYDRRRWLHTFRGGLRPFLLGAVQFAAILAAAATLTALGGFVRSLALNLLTGAAIAAVGYLYFTAWIRHRATRRIRQIARERPSDLFRAPPNIDPEDIVGRDDLVEQIAADLAGSIRSGPQIVVGRTGSGKTTLLLKLAHYFAGRGVVPVPISLRGEQNLDFAALAHARFLDFVDPYVASSEEGERVWRSLCQRNQLVVLADDLDASAADDPADERRAKTRRALEATRDRGLALVVTSRRVGVPPDLEGWSSELDALTIDDAQATRYILRTSGRRQQHPAGETVAALVRAGRLDVNPFFLDIAATLLAEHELPAAQPSVHATRLALLDAYRDGLASGRIAADTRLAPAEREAALAQLETIAIDVLVPGRSGPEPPAAAARSTAERHALYVAERLGLLEVLDAGGAHEFRHEVLHAYLASRVLRAAPQRRRDAIAAGAQAPVVQLALILAAAAMPTRSAKAAARHLLDAAQPLPADDRLLVVIAAAELSRAAGLEELRDSLALACTELRPAAGRLAKLAAVRELQALGGPSAYRALWAFATDAEYAVRWEAASALAQTGSGAYATLAPHIGDCLNAAEEAMASIPGPLDDWVEPVLSLKHIAWLLPSLRTAARRGGDADAAAAAQDDLDRLHAIAGTLGVTPPRPLTLQRGLEASIAQGLKADALRHRGESVDPQALRMLTHARFWYSQLNLVHALALSDDREARDAIERVRHREGAHPFVRAAARLALEDLDRGVWDDEGAVVARRPGCLSSAAAQLVGDIVVLLNMNEAASEAQRLAFGDRDTLPHCFASSRDRHEVFGREPGCPRAPACPFELCPYRKVSGRSAHREVSKAFCRHQRALARPRVARRWGSNVGRRALRDFWEQLESRARI